VLLGAEFNGWTKDVDNTSLSLGTVDGRTVFRGWKQHVFDFGIGITFH